MLMDEQTALAVMSGERRDATAQLLRGLCRVASWGYAAATRLRNTAYDNGWRKVHHAAAPVISVGNITTGGTGKTPLVAWLVHELIRRGYRPGILSRGYARLDDTVNDEALVLDRLCPGVPHIQQRDRVQGAAIAVEQHGCNVLVLDDGFQHRRLHRDLDLVLVDALRPWGFGHVLPRGLLREPLQGLWRADLVAVTRADLADPDVGLDVVQRVLWEHRGSDEHLRIRFAPQGWVSPRGETCSLDTWSNSRAGMFCGIGNPDGLVKTLEPLVPVVARQTFGDHHHYTTTDLDALAAWRQQQQLDVLATTLKDLVKIPAEHPVAEHVWAVDIRAEFLSGRERIETALDGVCPMKCAQRAA